MSAPFRPAKRIIIIPRPGRSPAPVSPSDRLEIRRYEVVPDLVGWVLPEGSVPETVPHVDITCYFTDVLTAWAERTGRKLLVARNLGVYWDKQHPTIGVDPGVSVIEPPPPNAQFLMCLQLWRRGHVPPCLAIEVVTRNHPYKDFAVAPEKYAACSVGELWVLDPFKEGPRVRGGPHRIQIWCWADEDTFARIYAGEGPVWSEAVQGWVRAVDGGKRFEIFDKDPVGKPWLTPYERERAAREAAERRADAERAAKEAALRELAALKAQLGRGP